MCQNPMNQNSMNLLQSSCSVIQKYFRAFLFSPGILGVLRIWIHLKSLLMRIQIPNTELVKGIASRGEHFLKGL